MPKQPDMNAMMRQVAQMQQEMEKAQASLKDESVEATVGGGTITVKVSGDMEVLDLKIDPAAIDPEDADMLQDMLIAAVNEALRSAQEMAANKMGAVTGGMGGPGGPLGGLGLPGM